MGDSSDSTSLSLAQKLCKVFICELLSLFNCTTSMLMKLCDSNILQVLSPLTFTVLFFLFKLSSVFVYSYISNYHDLGNSIDVLLLCHPNAQT